MASSTTDSSHGFSHHSMRVLTAICDTFVPSLPYRFSNAIPAADRNWATDKDLVAFYELSAAADSIPEQVAGTMARYLRPADVESVKALLRLLGTRLGTWAMMTATRLRRKKKKSKKMITVGVDDDDAYAAATSRRSRRRFAAFHVLPLSDRQAILRAWALGSPLPSFTIPFLLLKIFILRQFYYKVDAHGRNPVVWKAIDYCGPDPRLTSVDLDECDYILESRIVDMSNITAQGKRMLRSEFAMKIVFSAAARAPADHHHSSRSCIFNSAGNHVTTDKPTPLAHNHSRRATAARQMKADSKKGIVRVELKADAVIVGSGSGGSVVAAKLAEAGYKVVVMEKGCYLRRTQNSLLEGRSSSELYEQASNLATDDLGVFIFAGSTVGGGSTVNWSASFKTPEHVRREWAGGAAGLELFGSQQYSEAMEEVCRRIGVKEKEEEESLGNVMLRKGCRTMGLHVGTVPRNNTADHSCGWCGMGCKGGAKNSTPRTWLVDAASRGALILSGCEGRRVKTEPHQQGQQSHDDVHRHQVRATGLEARVVSGSAGNIRAWIDEEVIEAEYNLDMDVDVAIEVHVESKVVVSACGALHTPCLLRRSGLRNAHIGRNLRLHPVMFIWGHFPDAPPHLKSYQGPIMSSYCNHAAHWQSSGYGALLMVPSLHPAAFSAVTPWLSGGAAKDAMLRFSKTAFLITVTRDSGAGGYVWEDRAGDLHVSYNVSTSDRENCVEAACLGLRILAAAGAASIGTANLNGAALQLAPSKKQEQEAEVELEEYLSDLRHDWIKEKSPTVMGSAHQMGSCRMGRHPETSVVDSHGQTWEASGLFVADASVFPTATGVNPMVTVQSVALVISHSILRFLHSL